MANVAKISVSLELENLAWMQEQASRVEQPLSAMLNRLVANERRREAHSRARIAEGLARWRAAYPEPDETLREDMAAVRAVTNADVDL